MEPVRRPLPRPLVAAGVGGGLLALSLGIGAVLLSGGNGAAVQAASDPGAPATSPDRAAAALQIAGMREAREQVRASRDRALASPSATTAADVTITSAAPPTDTAATTATTTEPTTVAPTTTTPPPPPPLPAVVGRLWATTDVNVRSGPSSGTERIGSLGAITQVDVSGATENGWTQVVLDGKAGWVKSSYLSESKPEPKAAPAAPDVSGAACPISSSIESHLTSNARAVYRAVCAAYGGSVSSFGGYRAGDSGDHGSGRAVDIMVSGDPGWTIARFVQAHASELDVSYVIYQQKIWLAGNPTSQWKAMEDRGSTTANHYDHVHVSVN